MPARLAVVLGRDRGLTPVDGAPGTLDVAVPGQGIGAQHLGLDDEVGVLGRGGTHRVGLQTPQHGLGIPRHVVDVRATRRAHPRVESLGEHVVDRCHRGRGSGEVALHAERQRASTPTHHEVAPQPEALDERVDLVEERHANPGDPESRS